MESGDRNGRGDAPIGTVLERARRERGLSLGEVEDATKIRKRYLDGLEREDFSVLPDPVYVQGFLKTYANYLGLDGEGLAREFRDRRAPRRERQLDNDRRYRRSDFEAPLVNPGGLAGAERRRVSGATILTVALAVLVLALVIGLLYLIGSRAANTPAVPEDPPAQADRGQPAQPANREQPAEPNEAPAPQEEPREQASPAEEEAPAEEPPPEEEPAAETVSVVVSVPEVPVGLTIRADGVVVADVLAQPGYAQTFEARDAVVVEAANGGAVTVEVDGEDRGYLGYYGQPITQTFSRETPE